MKKILLIFLLLFIVSCRTVTKTIEVEKPIEKIRTEYVDKVKYDSLYLHDSVFVSIKNDTTYIYKEKIRYKYKYLRDTISIIDSIPVPINIKETVIEEVNVLHTWQKILMALGIGFIIFVIVKLIKA